MNGSNNNNTFQDSSSNAFSVTRSGSVAQGSFSPFSKESGKWSNYFDGSGSYLRIPAINLASAFTIEGWFFRNSEHDGIVASGQPVPGQSQNW